MRDRRWEIKGQLFDETVRVKGDIPACVWSSLPSLEERTRLCCDQCSVFDWFRCTTLYFPILRHPCWTGCLYYVFMLCCIGQYVAFGICLKKPLSVCCSIVASYHHVCSNTLYFLLHLMTCYCEAQGPECVLCWYSACGSPSGHCRSTLAPLFEDNGSRPAWREALLGQ